MLVFLSLISFYNFFFGGGGGMAKLCASTNLKCILFSTTIKFIMFLQFYRQPVLNVAYDSSEEKRKKEKRY